MIYASNLEKRLCKEERFWNRELLNDPKSDFKKCGVHMCAIFRKMIEEEKHVYLKDYRAMNAQTAWSIISRAKRYLEQGDNWSAKKILQKAMDTIKPCVK